MIILQSRSIIHTFILLSLASSIINSAEKDHADYDSQGRSQSKMTQFYSKAPVKPKSNSEHPAARPRATPFPRMASKSDKKITIDLTKDSQPTSKRLPSISHRPIDKLKESSKVSLPPQHVTSQDQRGQKRTVIHVDPTESAPKRSRKVEAEMQLRFLHGTGAHVQAYSDLIDQAEQHIIIASWNINFIPQDIFSSLMEAKRRGVHISFVVNTIKRKQTLTYFNYGEEDKDEETTFDLFETKSHAKFIFVDSKSLIIGSFNALGESYEESDDASFMLRGTVNQLWPFYMSIYETYTYIGEDLGGIFDGIATISKARNPGKRPLLQRSFEDGSQIFLLRTIKEHEDFFKLATPHNGKVTIYSPFSTKDNTLKRLKTLDSLLAADTEVHLKVLQQFESGLKRLLSQVPSLKSHTTVDCATSHQKIIILGDSTICAGSLNWLSAAQDSKDPYSNVELSVVLQGPKAEGIIKKHYSL